MSKKKNQHFVPRFYFRYFSNDGKRISLLNIASGKTVKDAPIKSQCSKDYYYGDKDMEDALEGLENEHRNAINKLKACLAFGSISMDEYIFVLQAALFQRARTMAAREKTKEPNDKLLRLHLEVSINRDPSLTEEARATYIKQLDNIQGNPQRYQAIAMWNAIEGVEHIVDLRHLLLINKTKNPFIFGDAPVVYYNNYQMDVALRGVPGLQTPGLQIFYPLSQDIVLLLLDPMAYHVYTGHDYIVHVESLDDVNQLNKLQIHNSFKSVYFGDYKFAAYMKSLWVEERSCLAKAEDRFIQAPGYDQSGNPIGDIIHIYEPLLPFRLRLSFLTHDIIGDGDFKFARRHELIEKM